MTHMGVCPGYPGYRAAREHLMLSRATGLPYCLYSLYCREEKFSETGLPVFGVLGNSERVRVRARRSNESRALTNALYSPCASGEGDAPVWITRQAGHNPFAKVCPPLFA